MSPYSVGRSQTPRKSSANAPVRSVVRLAVVLGVVLASLASVMNGVRRMSMRRMCMVSRRFVGIRLMMFGGFTMVLGGVFVMFRSGFVMFDKLVLWHGATPWL